MIRDDGLKTVVVTDEESRDEPEQIGYLAQTRSTDHLAVNHRNRGRRLGGGLSQTADVQNNGNVEQKNIFSGQGGFRFGRRRADADE